MFGVSFGELTLLVLLAIVLIGPRNMPDMMRKLGQGITKARRLATDLRQQSGIDEILQNEGIHREVQELQKLATGRIMDIGLDFEEPIRPRNDPATRRNPPRNREYPPAGVDCFDALPDDAEPYRAAELPSKGESAPGEPAALAAGPVVVATAPGEPAAADAAVDLGPEGTVSRSPAGTVSRGSGAMFEEATGA
jgi:sec-independent protein translocase protein TatB